jgi:hypothetical protein
MRPAIKFVLATGASWLLAFGAVVVTLVGLGFLHDTNLALILTAALIATVVVLVACVARFSRRGGITRLTSFGLPLLYYWVTFLLCMGGDAQEHLVRGFLHNIHRVLPQEWVWWPIIAVVLAVPLLTASLLWLAVSVSLGAFELKTTLILGAFSWGFVGFGLAITTIVFLLLKRVLMVGVITGLVTLAVGLVLFLILRKLWADSRVSRVLAFPGGTLLLCSLAAGLVLLKSSPETRLPEGPPLRTLDLSKAGSLVDPSKGWSRFTLLSDTAWSWSVAPKVPEPSGDAVFPRRPMHFKAESARGEGIDLWLEDGGQRRLLIHYRCGEIALYQISEDRVLATSCTQWGVFDLQGNQVGGDDFVRPEVRFAAVSQDHRRFAVIVFLVGFGDPPHLEEETIVVYDTAGARPVLAVNFDRLPQPESWAALSPDGGLLAVGADHTLRVFGRPPAKGA